MASFADAAGLIVAELNLKMVESVLQAIRTADIQSGIDKPPRQPVIVEPPRDAARVSSFTNCREAAATYEAGYEAGRSRTLTGHCCYAQRPIVRPAPPAPIIEKVVVEKLPDDLCSPLQPPWKSLPWEQPAPDAPHIKIVPYEPDMRHKGTLVDCFV